MPFVVEKYKEVLVVVLDGTVDEDCVRELDEVLDTQLAGGTRHMVIDLIEVAYMKSACAGLIIKLYRDLSTQGKRMALVKQSEGFVRKFLDITGVSQIIPAHESRDAAVQSLGVTLES